MHMPCQNIKKGHAVTAEVFSRPSTPKGTACPLHGLYQKPPQESTRVSDRRGPGGTSLTARDGLDHHGSGCRGRPCAPVCAPPIPHSESTKLPCPPHAPRAGLENAATCRRWQ